MMRDEIARIIRHELSDPDLMLASVTQTEVSPDLHFARVWISTIGGDKASRERALDAVKRATGKIRHELAKTKAFRYLPEFDWKLDTSAEYASRIEAKLDQILPKDEPTEEPEPDDDSD